MTHTTSEVLNLAADLIERHGWKTGTWDTSGELCLEGAVIVAAGWRNESTREALKSLYRCPAYAAVSQYLDLEIGSENDLRIYGEPLVPVYAWNDAPRRTQAEVIELLRACAVIEAAKERADVREQVLA